MKHFTKSGLSSQQMGTIHEWDVNQQASDQYVLEAFSPKSHKSQNKLHNLSNSEFALRIST